MSQSHTEHTIVHCKNCGNSFHGNYCNACGQDAHTGKIDKHFLYHEIQHGLFHIDAGILYTLRELFTNPGKTIRLFIEGKRVKHFKPLAFLLVMAGLYAFVNHFLNINLYLNAEAASKNTNKVISMYNEFQKTHYAIYELLQLPLLSFIYYLFFKSYQTNYMEQLVINAYLMGQRILITMIILPLSYYFIGRSHPFVYPVIDITIPVLLFIWAYTQYYITRSKFGVVWRVIVAYLINYVLLLIIISAILTLLASFPKLIA